MSNIGIPSFLISFSKYRSFRSISSHRRTSLTNLRWKALTSGFSYTDETESINRSLSNSTVKYSRLWTGPVPVRRVRTHRRTQLRSAKTTGTRPFLRCGTATPWWRLVNSILTTCILLVGVDFQGGWKKKNWDFREKIRLEANYGKRLGRPIRRVWWARMKQNGQRWLNVLILGCLNQQLLSNRKKIKLTFGKTARLSLIINGGRPW